MGRRRRRTAVALSLLVLLAACARPLAGGRINLDPASVSAGLPRCGGDVASASHGVVFLLQGTDKSCGRPGGIPSIGLYVNPYDDAFIPRLDTLLAADCDPAEGMVAAPPPGLAIADLASTACRVDRSDGWIDVFVEAVAPIPDGKESQTGITAVLHTRTERLVADMVVFRRLIAAVRLARTAGAAQGSP